MRRTSSSRSTSRLIRQIEFRPCSGGPKSSVICAVRPPEPKITTMALDCGPHGWLVIDKPLGISSNRVVEVARRATAAKVGHAGTLDPLATGVLPIALGEATKTIAYAL